MTNYCKTFVLDEQKHASLIFPTDNELIMIPTTTLTLSQMLYANVVEQRSSAKARPLFGLHIICCTELPFCCFCWTSLVLSSHIYHKYSETLLIRKPCLSGRLLMGKSIFNTICPGFIHLELVNPMIYLRMLLS